MALGTEHQEVSEHADTPSTHASPAPQGESSRCGTCFVLLSESSESLELHFGRLCFNSFKLLQNTLTHPVKSYSHSMDH